MDIKIQMPWTIGSQAARISWIESASFVGEFTRDTDTKKKVPMTLAGHDNVLFIIFLIIDYRKTTGSV